MGKKKAGKKLSPEEKLLAEQQAAIEQKAEEEKRKELATQFLREKLAQEEQNTRVSVRKLNEQWRQILRQAKTADLKNEIEILSQTFERVLDRKNAVVKSLAQEIEEASKQEEMALQAHLQKVDHLIVFQKNLMAEMHKDFEKNLATLTTEFKSEREQVLESHNAELLDIKDMLFAMNLQHEDAAVESMEVSNSKRDDIRNKDIEEREHLKNDLEKVINDLWELFQQALENYKHQTAEKQRQFEEMREADREAAADIEKNTRQISRYQSKINALKQRLHLEQREYDQRNKSLKQEKEKILSHFQVLKGQMNKSRGSAREGLTKLTVESRECIEKLEERKKQAEALLKMAELCRKLETEEEKILPFYPDTIPNEEVDAAVADDNAQFEKEQAENTPPQTETTDKHQEEQQPQLAPPPQQQQAFVVDVITGEPVQEFNMMDNFWKRYNKALLDKLAIEKEQEKLEDENMRLRSVLKNYLDGISVNENVLANDNTLFVVNGRTNASHMQSVPVGDGRVQGGQQRAMVSVQNLGAQQAA